MPKPLIIAIDGPAGAGKSTVAQKLAERLGLAYVDSGATYRAAALKVLDLGVLPDDVRAVAGVVANADIRIATDGSRSRVFLDGADVSEQIRSAEVTVAAAQVSRLSSVREKLIALQRTLASGRGVVMEGRDIGTVVFPDAPLKIFLEADPEERARRRLEQETREGRAATLEQTAYEIQQRDQLDAERKISPLVAAPDAVKIDSTRLTADQVVERVLDLSRERGLVETGAPTMNGNL
ncbi:MAG: (d)CMP kinase [Acidobacteria bacterium]|nr:MAG: (d)CMP kinase [Acidobacteriota bacterium]